jgi:hypothetical protein
MPGSKKTGNTPDDEDIGYGKPPKRSQFKAGRSGNPRGRPKGALNSKTILRRNLSRKIVVREGQVEREVSKLEGILMRQIELALKGDNRAAQQLLKFSIEHGAVAPPKIEVEEQPLSAAEQDILDEIIGTLKNRHT